MKWACCIGYGIDLYPKTSISPRKYEMIFWQYRINIYQKALSELKHLKVILFLIKGTYEIESYFQ